MRVFKVRHAFGEYPESMAPRSTRFREYPENMPPRFAGKMPAFYPAWFRGVLRNHGTPKAGWVSYVPCSQPFMYLSCSLVRASMVIPIDSSLWRGAGLSTPTRKVLKQGATPRLFFRDNVVVIGSGAMSTV